MSVGHLHNAHLVAAPSVPSPRITPKCVHLDCNELLAPML
jgi:hypothetical protein